MFASTFKRTHWLVPGYCLGQISCVEKSVTTTAPEPMQCCQQPREDRSYPGQLFLWEMESHGHWWTTNRFRHQPLETFCCTRRTEWSCTTYFVFCLEFLYQVGASSANSNPGTDEHDGLFLEIYTRKTRSWHMKLNIEFVKGYVWMVLCFLVFNHYCVESWWCRDCSRCEWVAISWN